MFCVDFEMCLGSILLKGPSAAKFAEAGRSSGQLAANELQKYEVPFVFLPTMSMVSISNRVSGAALFGLLIETPPIRLVSESGF